MQTDGNLVVYSASGTPLFATGARGDAGSRLVVQTDGNAVVYAGSGAPLWSSKLDTFVLVTGQILRAGQWRTSIDGRFLLAMQPDGNLVLYEEPSHRPLWSSNTANNPGAWTALQPDGNLVVYSRAGEPLFASGTSGDPGTKLVVQVDGNVVIYDGAGRPLWSTRTTTIH
jgi:hypothetical protein